MEKGKRTRDITMSMSNKEAIKMQEAIKAGLKETGKDHPYRDALIPLMKESCETAIEALEKQIPKKAELCYEDLICPVCGSDVEWKRYCEECGQRIDTGDEL